MESHKIVLREEGQSFESRKQGLPIQLEHYRTELSSVLGINPTINQNYSFQTLARAYRDKFPSDATPCLRQGQKTGLLVNNQLCLWCPSNTDCREMEKGGSSSKVSFTLFCAAENPDFERLKRFIDEKEFLCEVDQDFFSNAIDPFSPGFSINEERELQIFPLAEFFAQQSPIRSPVWSHLFYCIPLARTATMFESQIIDLLPRKSLGISRQEEKGFLSIADFIAEVESAREYRYFDNEKSLARFLKIEQSDDDLNVDYEWRKQKPKEWSAIIQLIQRVQEKIPMGLYNHQTELIHTISINSDLCQHVAQFLWNLYVKILEMGPAINRALPLLEERQSGIILVPKTRSESLMFSTGCKILRIIPIDNLNDPWIIVDGSSKSQISATDWESPPLTFFDSKINQIPPLLLEIFTQITEKRLVSWDEKQESSPDPISIRWFPPSQIHAAHSLHHQLNSIKSRYTNPAVKKAYDNLDKFMSMFYTPNQNNRTDFNLAMNEMKLQYRLPSNRKTNPLNCIYKLEKFTKQNLAEWNFLDITTIEHESENLTIETITFNHLGGLDQGSCKFTREYSNQGRRRSENTLSNIPFEVWHNVSARGAEKMVNVMANALSVINVYSESQDRDRTAGGLWLSPKIHDLILKADQSAKVMCNFISNMSDSMANMGVLFVAADGSEMQEIRAHFGKIEPPPQSIVFGQDTDTPLQVDMMLWNPTLTVSESGQNFVYFGRFI